MKKSVILPTFTITAVLQFAFTIVGAAALYAFSYQFSPSSSSGEKSLAVFFLLSTLFLQSSPVIFACILLDQLEVEQMRGFYRVGLSVLWVAMAAVVTYWHPALLQPSGDRIIPAVYVALFYVLSGLAGIVAYLVVVPWMAGKSLRQVMNFFSGASIFAIEFVLFAFFNYYGARALYQLDERARNVLERENLEQKAWAEQRQAMPEVTPTAPERLGGEETGPADLPATDTEPVLQ